MGGTHKLTINIILMIKKPLTQFIFSEQSFTNINKLELINR